MEQDFDTLIDKWDELNALKDAYIFGDELFDKELFTQVVKESFSAIRLFRSICRDFKNHIEEIDDNLLSFSNLLVYLANYSAEIYARDESEQYIFSASQAIVRLLLQYATCPCQVEPTEDTGELFGTFEDCGLYCSGKEYNSDDEFWMQQFKYDTNTGDMSQIIELAKRSLG